MPELCAVGIWRDKKHADKTFPVMVAPACKLIWDAGGWVEWSISLHEDRKSDRQRRFYHGVVLKQIALQASVNGVRHDLQVWKEYFRSEYLGYKTGSYLNPITGKKSRRRKRISTEELGVREYSRLIEKVMAYAVTELGVIFPMRWEEYEAAPIDLDTGEVILAPMPPAGPPGEVIDCETVFVEEIPQEKGDEE